MLTVAKKQRGTRRCGARVSLQTLSHVAVCLPPVSLFQGLMDNQPLSPRYAVCGCQQGNTLIAVTNSVG